MSMKFVNLRKSDLKGYRFNYKVPVFETASKLVLTENEIARKQKELLRAKINDDYDKKYGEGVRHSDYNDRYKHQPGQEEREERDRYRRIIQERENPFQHMAPNRSPQSTYHSRLPMGLDHEPNYVLDLAPIDDGSFSGVLPGEDQYDEAIRPRDRHSPSLSITEDYQDIPDSTEVEEETSMIRHEIQKQRSFSKAIEEIQKGEGEEIRSRYTNRRMRPKEAEHRQETAEERMARIIGEMEDEK